MSMLQGRIYDNLMQVVDGDGKRKRERERDTARKLFFFSPMVWQDVSGLAAMVSYIKRYGKMRY